MTNHPDRFRTSPASPPAAPPGERPASRAPLVLAAIALAILVAWLVLGRRAGEEDQVRAVIDGIEEGIEAKRAGDVLAYVSESFKGEEGMGRRELKGYLVGRFLGSRDAISIRRVGDTLVQLRGPKQARTGATASFRAKISDSGALGSALEREAWDFEVELAREGGEWRVTGYRRVAAP